MKRKPLEEGENEGDLGGKVRREREVKLRKRKKGWVKGEREKGRG